ncbi:MAG TPA: TonB-dependent receptor, partial [Candidatus Krumholzibacteria bacterium]|nr:TonB-dependent receptor [Candidatus Krumholzibacteria bacterium]
AASLTAAAAVVGACLAPAHVRAAADASDLDAAVAAAALVDTFVVRAAAADAPLAPQVGGLCTRIDLHEAGGSRDLADVLAAAAGLQVRRYGAAGASAVPSLRGSAAAQVRLFVDGMPLDDAESGVFDLERLPLERFGSLEIHRGVVPVGLGGIGGAGAVNLLTGRTRDGAAANLGVGAFGERWAGASWGQAARGGRPGLLLMVHGRSADNDFRYLDHNQTFHRGDDDTVRVRENAWLREHGLFAKAEGAAGPLALRGWAGFVRRDGGRPGPVGAYASPHATVRYDRLDGCLGVGWRHDLVRLELAGARTDETLHDPEGEVGFAPPGATRTQADDATVRLAWAPSRDLGGGVDLALRLGVERRGQWQRQRWNDLQDPERHRTGTTAFATADLGLGNGRLRLAPAWRWQRTEDDFPPIPALPWLPEPAPERHVRDDVSPSAGLSWELSPGVLVLEAHAARTVRTPTWIELFGHRGGVVGNRELVPETVQAVDLALSYRAAGGGWGARVAAFDARTDDTIIFVVNSQRTSRAVNAGATRTRGLECEARVALPLACEARGNLTWQHARDRGGDPAYDGKALPYLPDLEAFLRLRRAGRTLRPWCELRVQSSNYLDRANTELNMADGRARVDLGLEAFLPAPVAGSSLTAEMAVLNLTDESTYDIEGFPLPGRSWRAGLELAF